MQYDYLQKYRYESVKAAEEFLSEEHPHFFIRKDPETVEKGATAIKSQLNVTLPQEMIEFWKNAGPGQFFCEPPDEYAGRYHMMSSDEILGVYFPALVLIARPPVWEKSPRTRRPAPRAMLGAAAVHLRREKTSSHIPRTKNL